MDLTVLMGLYIRRGYDNYNNILFKSIYQLGVDEIGLYMRVVDGGMIGFCKRITYEELEREYISISKFMDEASYIGYNAVRIANDNDLNFTGCINERTGEQSDPNELFTTKKQILLYGDENNLLMYYDENFDDPDNYDILSGIFFLNGKYPLDAWIGIENYQDSFESKEIIKRFIYNMDTVRTNRIRIR